MSKTDPAWWKAPIPAIDEKCLAAARTRQTQLTKPPGSLGRLEAVGVTLAAMQGTQQPSLDQVAIAIFAADHGMAEEGVSAYPPSVTAAMVRNFAQRGAAISVLADMLDAKLYVVNMGTREPLQNLPQVWDRRMGPGTANFLHAPAMTWEQRDAALQAGREAADFALAEGAQLLIGGEMGIGNTTAAAALGTALLPCSVRQLVGPGTGVDETGMTRKRAVIEAAVVRHAPSNALDALQCLGGFEIAALVGAYIRCGQRGIPILVDGFVTAAAALVAVTLRPELRDWLFHAHLSQEPGHQYLLQALQGTPLLDLQLRLGEGSGAAVALPLLRAAAALHGRMATFAEAGM
jgi:nicotinate-nucleotide--dimethylbenzimidazole phosphoribosyltransferase